jgi:hypothetical protein
MVIDALAQTDHNVTGISMKDANDVGVPAEFSKGLSVTRAEVAAAIRTLLSDPDIAQRTTTMLHTKFPEHAWGDSVPQAIAVQVLAEAILADFQKRKEADTNAQDCTD